MLYPIYLAVLVSLVFVAVGAGLPQEWQDHCNPLQDHASAHTSRSDTSTSSTARSATTLKRSTKKKGAGFWASTKADTAIQQLGATWAYSWSPDPEAAFSSMGQTAPAGVELVPLVGTADNNVATFTAIKSNPAFSHILGFNEPDGSVNSLSAQAAASSWPNFIATGKRVGSPAPAHTSLMPGDWFYEFMAAIEAAGFHVDFIALHYYASEFGDVGAAVANFRAYVQAVYEMYKLPIWVTEFAMVDYSAFPSFTTPHDATQVEFLNMACEMLDGLEYVERYAWFAVPESQSQPKSNLVDQSGILTPMGRAYKAL